MKLIRTTAIVSQCRQRPYGREIADEGAEVGLETPNGHQHRTLDAVLAFDPLQQPGILPNLVGAALHARRDHAAGELFEALTKYALAAVVLNGVAVIGDAIERLIDRALRDPLRDRVLPEGCRARTRTLLRRKSTSPRKPVGDGRQKMPSTVATSTNDDRGTHETSRLDRAIPRQRAGLASMVPTSRPSRSRRARSRRVRYTTSNGFARSIGRLPDRATSTAEADRLRYQSCRRRLSSSSSSASAASLPLKASILRTAWRTVVWSRPPKRRPISGSDRKVRAFREIHGDLPRPHDGRGPSRREDVGAAHVIMVGDEFLDVLDLDALRFAQAHEIADRRLCGLHRV